MEHSLPLQGIRVLELGRYISAPFAARQLADLGADVLKIENPDGGDPMRDWQPIADDDTGGAPANNPQFTAYNQGKRSMALDIRDEPGRKRIYELVQDADVVIENFRPGVATRLQLDWEHLRPLNPRLVYCSITGFGHDGPYRERPAYDTVVSALCGLYSLMIKMDDSPSLVGPAVSDLVTGMFAVQGILAAIVERARTGCGRRVDVTMLGSMLTFLREPVQTYLETGEVTLPDTRLRRGGGHICVSSDDRPFVVHASVPSHFWLRLLTAFDRLDLLSDERFKDRAGRFTYYYDLDAILKESAAKRPLTDWLVTLQEADVPHSVVNFVDDVLGDPQVQHMQLVATGDNGTGVRTGLQFTTDGAPTGGGRVPPAPTLDEHGAGFAWVPR